MKVLIIGSGGRENAIAWKVSQNKKIEKIFCAPGNGGTAIMDICENIDITDIYKLKDFVVQNNIDLTIVGPEVPLVEGIVDIFRKSNLKIFGPDKKASKLEGSKAYSKEFMEKYGVKTAEYETFTESEKAFEYIEKCSYPVVIKADGLASGKGVAICESYEDAKKAIKEFMIDDIFKGSGKKIVIEEFLEGFEASILSITDGNVILPFISAKDHKQIYDENKGPNTGGMGVISPNPYVTSEVMKEFNENILKPTLTGIQNENMDYIGIIFFGIMITKKGVYLLEYNVRMGDPETQAVLPLMDSDLVELIDSSLNKDLKNFNLKWSNNSCCCVVAASKGYPKKFETGIKISGVGKKDKVFVAGAKFKDNDLYTSGGRVLCVYETASTLEDSIKRAYSALDNVHFDNMYYRKDIGKLY